jgi:hypothetical protein
VLALAADASGAALAAGYFESPACTFGTGAGAVVLANGGGAGGGADAFALKVSAAGTVLWAVRLGGAGYDVVWGAAVAPDSGDLLVAGSFDGDALMAGAPPSAVVLDASAPGSGTRDGFVARVRAAYICAAAVGRVTA